MTVTDKNFGVVIAFLIPGSLLLWGLSYSFNGIAAWFLRPDASATIAGFLFSTLASLGLGLLLSAIRWMIVDHVLIYIGRVKPSVVDFSKLNDPNRFASFQGIVENHYRYYQYYANTLVAVVIAFSVYVTNASELPASGVCILLALTVVALTWASYDCFKKYHTRTAEILR
jgi:hypothetical protein